MPKLSISWPGCGGMVFWQLGVLQGLSKHCDVRNVPMLGSSSGAFVTAIAACGVAPRHAAEEMLQLLVRDGLTKRRTGLLGVMGGVARKWLEVCLPNDAGALLSRRSTLLVTELPFLRTRHITHFDSKQDVLDVALASAHLPLLLDGTWYAKCRSQPVIDGGFWWWLSRCERSYLTPGGLDPAAGTTQAPEAHMHLPSSEGFLPAVEAGAGAGSGRLGVAAAGPGLYPATAAARQQHQAGDLLQRPGQYGATASRLWPHHRLTVPPLLADALGSSSSSAASDTGAQLASSAPGYVGPSGHSLPAVASGPVTLQDQGRMSTSPKGSPGIGTAASVACRGRPLPQRPWQSDRWSGEPLARTPCALSRTAHSTAGPGGVLTPDPPRSHAPAPYRSSQPPPGAQGMEGESVHRVPDPTRVHIIKPFDDPGVVAEWSKFRRWSAGDPGLARELMARGEAFAGRMVQGELGSLLAGVGQR